MKKVMMGLAAVAMAMSLSAAEYNWGLNSFDYVGPDGSGYIEDFGNFYDGGYAMLFLGTVTAGENAFDLGSATLVTAGGFDAANFVYGNQDPGAGLTSDKVTSTAAGQAFTIIMLDKIVTDLDGYEGNYAIINGVSADQMTNPGNGNYVAQFINSDPLTQGMWSQMTAAPVIPEPDMPNVPEPTSGLLLVLGVAGLALRRKQA